jgi:hypothetical protein
MATTKALTLANLVDTASGEITVPDTTASTSTTTGALKVSGGVGIAGDLNVGGTSGGGIKLISPDGSVAFSIDAVNYGNALSITHNGANAYFSVAGNNGDLFLTTFSGKSIKIDSATASTSTTTGALVVTGGVGISGSLNVGLDFAARQITTTSTAITLGATVSTGNTLITGSQSSGTIIIGGTTGTGAITLGRSTAAQTLNLGTGATTNGIVKDINIGTAGLSGSVNNITIGSAVGGTDTTLNVAGRVAIIQPTGGIGNVSNTAGGTTVTGFGTLFTRTFKVGDTVTIGGQTVAISAIASDTSMTTAAITNANTTIAYSLTGGTRLVVNGNGNVGIGTASLSLSTTAITPLVIQGQALLGVSGQTNNSNKDFRILSGSYVNNATTVIFASSQLTTNNISYGGGTGAGEPATNHLFFTGTIGTLGSGTERMRITSAGDLGVGTSSPSAQIHAYSGDIMVGSGASVASRMFRALEVGTAGNNAGISFGNNGAKGAVWGQSGTGGLYIVGSTNGGGSPLNFGYSASDTGLAANYSSLGVWNTTGLGIGTASPAYKLDTQGSARAYGFTSTAIGTPTVASGTSATTGGSLSASTTYYFKIVAVDGLGGVTLPSPEYAGATAASGTATNTINLTWTAVAGAKSYQVWYSTTTGTQANYFAATTNSFSFTTTTGNTAGTIPAINTTGNVGIGTGSPASKLTVVESTNAPYNPAPIPSNAAAAISYSNSYTNSVGLFVHRMANTDGWAPTIQLGSQYGSTNSAGSFIAGLGLGNILFSGWNNSNSAYLVGASIKSFPSTGWALDNAPAYLAFYTNGGAAAETERMRITSAGNVGIGNTNASYKLQVGTAAATAASVLSALTPVLYVDGGSTANSSIVIKTHTGGSGTVHGAIRLAVSPDAANYSWSGMAGIADVNGAASTLAFYTANSNTQGTAAGASTERMRIDQSGNVGIGSIAPSSITGGRCLMLSNTGFATISVQAVDDTNDRNATLELLSSGNGSSYSQILYGDTDTTPLTPSPLVFASYHSGVRTERMRIQPTTGYVGIGMDTPANKLDVYQSDSGIGSGRIRHVNGNAVNVQPSYNYYDAYNHIFRGLNGTTESIRINDSGSVILGYNLATSCQLSKSFATAHAVGNRGGDVRFGINDGSFGGIIVYDVASSNPSFNAQYIEFHTHQGAVSAGERMRITADGNVGIGTTAPGQKLHVAGRTYFATTSGAYEGGFVSGGANVYSLLYSSSTSGTLYMGVNGTTAGSAIDIGGGIIDNASFFGSRTAHPTQLISGNGVRVTIASTGEVSIGSTTVTSAKLNVVHAGTYGVYIGGAAGASTSVIFFSGATNTGSISTNGTSTAFNTSSDYRLKEEIAPLTGGLAKVALLKPVTYKWKSNGSDGEGFIAHELAEVCPQAVHGTKDGIDEDGKPVYQGMDTSFLVATLTKAIQEQQVMIEELKSRLAAAGIA